MGPRGDRARGLDDAAARALRDSKADRFFAMVDGEEREVRAAKTRGRWERIVSAARALGASSIDARDASGATLAVVELHDVDDEHGRDVDPAPTRDTGTAGEVERLLAVVLRAQDAAVARQAEQVQAITSAALSVMQASAARAASMERAVLALVQQRERDLEHAAAELEATARAMARADETARRERAEDESSELDAMATTLVREAVVPVLGQKIASMAAAKAKGTAA